MMNSIGENLLLFYALHLPSHRGKWRVMSALQNLLNLRASGDREVSRAGVRWVLDPSDDVQSGLYWFGSKDMWETKHLMRVAADGAVFFDIGANFGYYSVFLGAKKHCKVHAFEPNPSVCQRLIKNVELNRLDNVKVHRLGLSDQRRTAGLSVRGHNSGLTQVTEGNEIELSTLDEFCAEHDIQQIDLMKIDVEGHEDRVIRGGLDTLRKFRPTILLELNPITLSAQGSNIDRVVDPLSELGYQLYAIRRNKIETVSKVTIGDDEYMNVFCVGRTGR